MKFSTTLISIRWQKFSRDKLKFNHRQIQIFVYRNSQTSESDRIFFFTNQAANWVVWSNWDECNHFIKLCECLKTRIFYSFAYIFSLILWLGAQLSSITYIKNYALELNLNGWIHLKNNVISFFRCKSVNKYFF